MKAYLKNYRQAPRKVRLVAGLIKGKKVEEAIPMLDFLAKRAGFPIKKLLLSAVANASQMGVAKENLFIKELRVDKGIVMKRMMPAAMGTGHRINKRTSHITLVLGERENKIKAKDAKKKEIKKEIVKPVKAVKTAAKKISKKIKE
ncbi:MAG: 50S ribosomal protein L22 [Candidatus Paceibacterota bacterium]